MIRINLLPVKKSKKKRKGQRQLTLLITFIIIVMAALYVVYDMQEELNQEIAVKLKVVREEIVKYDKIIGDANTFTKKKKESERKLKIIDELRLKKIGPVRMLDEISNRVPKKIWLTQLTQEQNFLTLKGMALDNKEISLFMQELEKSFIFKNLHLKSISTKQENKTEVITYSFLIECEIKA